MKRHKGVTPFKYPHAVHNSLAPIADRFATLVTFHQQNQPRTFWLEKKNKVCEIAIRILNPNEPTNNKSVTYQCSFNKKRFVFLRWKS